MVTTMILHVANRVAQFGKEVREIWREAQRLRHAMPGPTEE
jgi:hypothetical protein